MAINCTAMAKHPTRRRIFDLVGEGQANRDGSSRQAELRRCVPGESVMLVREPDNPYDPNAILAVGPRGVGLGYLGRDDAAMLAAALDEGRSCSAIIHELRGGMPDYPSFGCRIGISWEGQAPLSFIALGEDQMLYGQGSRSGCLGLLLVAFTGTIGVVMKSNILALPLLLLAACATSAADIGRTEVEETLVSGKSAADWANCFAESLNGNNELRGAGDHYWVLRMNGMGVIARWDFRDRPEGGSVAELRTGGASPISVAATGKARDCA